MTLKRGYKQLVADAAARVHTLSVAEAQAKLGDSGAVFVDIREAAELDREGMIPGAFNAPRGMLEFWVDPESPYFKEAFAPGNQLILLRVCLAVRACRGNLARHGDRVRQPHRGRLFSLEKGWRPNRGAAKERLT